METLINDTKKLVEEIVLVKARKYKVIHTDELQPTHYEKKLLGLTAHISNTRGCTLAEKRFHAKRKNKQIKVRTI